MIILSGFAIGIVGFLIGAYLAVKCVDDKLESKGYMNFDEVPERRDSNAKQTL